MPKAPVSVVILAKNEAGRIEECLRSVAWADDLLLIDDESADRTAEIALGAGARVLKKRMEIEGRHRNWATAQARHDWVLSIDADERVTPELAREIQELLSGAPPCDIYSIPRRNHIGSRWIRHGGWYPSPQVKLFRKDRFQWEETTVHPRALSKSDKPWGELRQDLLHYSYRDLTDFIAKLNRQTTLEAQKWILDGRKMSMGKALWRSFDRFVRAFVSKKGYRDGFIGFFAAAAAGMYQFLSYAKYWHLREPPRESIPAPEGLRVAERPGGLRRKLSVVILTRNAAPAIGRCLESVRWADEIIAVDGGSTDETADLCRRAGARVIERPPTDDFGGERNVGTDAAGGEWVLQLDADEVVTPEFRAALEAILRSDDPHAAYKFHRTNFFLGTRMRFGGWEHDSLHLFRKGKARYEGRVHERLIVDGPVGTLAAGVHHYPFHSVEQFIGRQNRYTTLEALQRTEAGEPISMKAIRREAVFRPAKLFWKIEVKKQGFRNGTVGLLFAGLYAFVHFLKWAKVWEILYAGREETGS